VKAVKIDTNLTQIPGIGEKMAKHLIDAGYPTIESLKGQDPNEVYAKNIFNRGVKSCRCSLYCYRMAVCYADNDGQLPPEKQNWWDWKD